MTIKKDSFHHEGTKHALSSKVEGSTKFVGWVETLCVDTHRL